MLIYNNPSPQNIRRNRPETNSSSTTASKAGSINKKRRLPNTNERRRRPERRFNQVPVSTERRRVRDRRSLKERLYDHQASNQEDRNRVGVNLSIDV